MMAQHVNSLLKTPTDLGHLGFGFVGLFVWFFGRNFVQILLSSAPWILHLGTLALQQQ